MNRKTGISTYHVLLIGIDQYPPGYNSLHGCVNDIDAIEKLLFEPPGMVIPPEQIKVTRLAAPHPGRPSQSRFQAKTLLPTKANVVDALKGMAEVDVNQTDRVLIYYSGHGDEVRWKGSSVWHEALVPHDGQTIDYLFDVEINGLVNAIAERTNDLTIVLDCCHSAGATRDLSDIQAQGAIRVLKGPDVPAAPPDLTALGLGSGAAGGRGVGKGLLQSSNPDFLVVVACQSDEKAGEGGYPQGQAPHGVFTHSLLSVLGDMDAKKRADLHWTDIWPELLAKAAERNGRLSQRAQHPWMIGRAERRIFGGPWEKMDAGYRVTKRRDGSYEVGAGKLMGVTEGAEIAVYGPEPRLFPAIGSPEDRPVGRVKVKGAGPSSAVAAAVGAAFSFPEGARGRLSKPGESQLLRVSLKPEDATLKTLLEKSPLLELVPAATSDADIKVIAQPGGGWILENDAEPLLATVPVGEHQALRAGLESYYRYRTVLRMACNCNDPQLANSLNLSILDCSDQTALKAMSPQKLADPNLPEAPRDEDKIYRVQPGFMFCVKVTNSSSYHLNVTLLNCSAGGLVEYLSDALLRDGAAHVMWVDGKLGEPFEAEPDEIPAGAPGISVPVYTTERMIAIGTTRLDVDLHSLEIKKSVQEVVDENCSDRGEEKRSLKGKKEKAAPAELWTATVVPIRIARQ